MRQNRLSHRLVVLFICLFGASLRVPAQEVLAVGRGSFESKLLLTGELVARDAVNLYVPNVKIWPLLITWVAEDGLEVAEGEVVVEFDDGRLSSTLEDLESAVSEARNNLASQRATTEIEKLDANFRLKQKQIDLAKAELDADVPPGVLSTQEYASVQLVRARAELAYQEEQHAWRFQNESSEAELAAARIELTTAEIAVQRVRQRLTHLSLTAPRAGVLIVREHPEEGRPFRAGDSAWPGTIVASFPDLSSMIVEARLFDADDGRMKVGAAVTAIVDAFQDNPMQGTVTQIDNIANQTSPKSLRRAFRTFVRLDDIDPENMRPGMSVKLVVEYHLENQLLIPRQALRWEEDDRGSRVLARLEDESWQEVKLGLCNQVSCVLSKGLSEGTVIHGVARGGDRQ